MTSLDVSYPHQVATSAATFIRSGTSNKINTVKKMLTETVELLHNIHTYNNLTQSRLILLEQHNMVATSGSFL